MKIHPREEFVDRIAAKVREAVRGLSHGEIVHIFGSVMMDASKRMMRDERHPRANGNEPSGLICHRACCREYREKGT